MNTYTVPADKIDAAAKILNTHGDTIADCRDALRGIVGAAEKCQHKFIVSRPPAGMYGYALVVCERCGERK